MGQGGTLVNSQRRILVIGQGGTLAIGQGGTLVNRQGGTLVNSQRGTLAKRPRGDRNNNVISPCMSLSLLKKDIENALIKNRYRKT